jgi:hypothetical protein
MVADNIDLEAGTHVSHHSGAPSIILAQSSLMVIEKEVGGSEAIEMTTRPGLSEMTSNDTPPVTTNQAVDQFLRPVVPLDAGTFVFFPCHRTSDQINYPKSFVYG